MQGRVCRFFELRLEWLRNVLRDGVAAGEPRADRDIEKSAALVVSVLEGASLVAWAVKDAGVIRPAFEQAVARLTP
jgi:TetR/AcrR family transcriptional repressor of nem operon